MKILSINSVPYGSTCKIMTGISELVSKDHSACVATGFSTHPVNFNIEQTKIGGVVNKGVHMLLSKATGCNGVHSITQTKKFLKWVDKYNANIIHLHNLHGWYINLPLLFNYIKKEKSSIVWTLHDCWAFTGHCPHFSVAKCDKWKTGCHHCSQYREYPQSYVDCSKMMWSLKKKWFSGVKNLTIVTPSRWLADLVKESFLKDYPVKVIYNGIDLNIFRPTPSDFRAKYHCEDKFILLGVAFGWGPRKGLDVFVELAKRLNEQFQIVLVGTDRKTDKQLPENIISIRRTQNQTELAEIYTAADLFVNPTREEVLGLVNLESLACGTPVVTFRTGGSPECIDETCGSVVECDDVDALEQEILRIAANKLYSKEACLNRARAFDMYDRFQEYLQLYENLVK